MKEGARKGPFFPSFFASQCAEGSRAREVAGSVRESPARARERTRGRPSACEETQPAIGRARAASSAARGVSSALDLPALASERVPGSGFLRNPCAGEGGNFCEGREKAAILFAAAAAAAGAGAVLRRASEGGRTGGGGRNGRGSARGRRAEREKERRAKRREAPPREEQAGSAREPQRSIRRVGSGLAPPPPAPPRR